MKKGKSVRNNWISQSHLKSLLIINMKISTDIALHFSVLLVFYDYVVRKQGRADLKCHISNLNIAKPNCNSITLIWRQERVLCLLYLTII